MNKLKDFIVNTPEGSEKDYFNKLYKIIIDLDVDTSNKQLGIGLILFLDRCDLVSDDFNTITHPGAGSTYENTLFVSNMFEKLKLSAPQWRVEFLKVSDDAFLMESIEWWRGKFRESPKVIDVIC